MNHSVNASLVAVGACFSALVAVCTLQGSSDGVERSRASADIRAGSSGRVVGAAVAIHQTESSQMAHIIGDVLLPPNAEQAFFLPTVLPNRH